MTVDEFETGILPCHRKMYAAAHFIVNDSDEASDVVQEAFARLWERREEIPNPNNPEGYCLTVVRRIAIDKIRRRRLMQISIDNVNIVADNIADRSLEDADSLQRVNKLMKQLPANQRKVIQLSAMAGLNNTEIATATGLSDVNVRALLSRGRKMLRKLFENE